MSFKYLNPSDFPEGWAHECCLSDASDEAVDKLMEDEGLKQTLDALVEDDISEESKKSRKAAKLRNRK